MWMDMFICSLYWIVIYFIFCSVTFIFGVYSYLLYLKWIYRNIPGPSPEWHFLGNVIKLRQCTKKGEYYHFQFLRWVNEYGQLYRVFLFHKVMLVSANALIAKKILTDSRYPKSELIYTRVSKACGKRFLGQGLVTNFKHRNWKQRRACLNPAFKKSYLKGLIAQFNAIADKWVESLEKFCVDETFVNMSEMLARVTVATIGKVAFSMDIKSIENKNPRFLDSLNTILEGMSMANKDPLMMYKISNKKKIKEVQEAVHFIRQLCRKELSQRIKSGCTLNSSHEEDMVSFLLQSKDLYSNLSVEDLVDDFVTIFVAGQETTANALAFLLTEVGRNEEILHRLENEIQRTVGASAFVTDTHIAELQYMTQVWKETLRLYPPAPATVRDIPAHTKIADFSVPIKSTIIFPFFVIHRMSDYYNEPDHFDPDRWGTVKQRHMYSFLPFSLGQRSCAGQHFAMIEAKIILCKFLQRFDFVLDTKQSFDIHEVTTLNVKGGAKMKLTLK